MKLKKIKRNRNFNPKLKETGLFNINIRDK